jgi:hypothetical protein
MLGLAGCSSGLLEASTQPPTGLDVAVTTSFSAGIVPTSGSVTGKGDSLCPHGLPQAIHLGQPSRDEGRTGTKTQSSSQIILKADAVQSCSRR